IFRRRFHQAARERCPFRSRKSHCQPRLSPRTPWKLHEAKSREPERSFHKQTQANRKLKPRRAKHLLSPSMGSFNAHISGWPTKAALSPTSGVCSEKMDANQPGLGTRAGGKALQPSFISCQVPSLQYLIVSLVTIGRGRVTRFGTSLPSSFWTASLSARAPE